MSGPVLHPRLEWIDFTHSKGILPSSFHSYPLANHARKKREALKAHCRAPSNTAHPKKYKKERPRTNEANLLD